MGIVLLSMIVIIILITTNGRTYKATIYIKNGVKYSCMSEYKWDELVRIVCSDSLENIVLIDSFSAGLPSGTHYSYHSNGQIKVIGVYDNGKQAGAWKEYYNSGMLKAYRFYIQEVDSSFVIYQKNYDENGELESLIYPISFYTTDTADIRKGEPFDLVVTLEYSEFDSVSIMCLFDNDNDDTAYEDTVYYYGRDALYEVIPKDTGWQKINGLLIEGNKGEYGGEREFVFEYYAKSPLPMIEYSVPNGDTRR